MQHAGLYLRLIGRRLVVSLLLMTLVNLMLLPSAFASPVPPVLQEATTDDTTDTNPPATETDTEDPSVTDPPVTETDTEDLSDTDPPTLMRVGITSTGPQVTEAKVKDNKLTICFDERLIGFVSSPMATAVANAVTVIYGDDANQVGVLTASTYEFCDESTFSLYQQALVITLASSIPYGVAPVLVSYENPGDEFALRNESGTTLVQSFIAGVTNLTGASPISATVDGDTLTLTYAQDLDAGSTPAPSAFTLYGESDWSGWSGSPKDVTVSGGSVILTVPSRLVAGESLSLTYRTPGSNPLKEADGPPVAGLEKHLVGNVTELSEDTELPVLLSEDLNRNTIELTFSKALNEDVLVPSVAFVVSPNLGGIKTIEVDGSKVRITLNGAASAGQQVYLSYRPRFTNGRLLEDLAGNDVREIIPLLLTNSTEHPPRFLSAIVNRDTLTLTYSKNLDMASKPAPEDFTVKVEDGDPIEVDGVSVANNLVILTLSAPVSDGAIVTLSYNTVGDNPPLRDLVGDAADSLDNEPVANLTGSELHVGPGQPFPTLESAVAVAASGNTIIVHQGEYTLADGLVVTQPNLTIRADAGTVAPTVEVQSWHGIVIDAPNVTIQGLHLLIGPGTGIEIHDKAAGATVQGNIFDGDDSYAGILVNDGFTGDLSINGNELQGSDFGIRVESVTNARVTIADNKVTNTDSIGVYIVRVGGDEPDQNVVQITGNTVSSAGKGIYLSEIDWEAHVVIGANNVDHNASGVVLERLGYKANDYDGQADYIAPRVEVRHNTITKNGYGIYWVEGYIGADSTLIIHHNTVTTNGRKGVYLDDIETEDGAQVTVADNLIADNGDEPDDGAGLYLGSGAQGVTVVHNQLKGNNGPAIEVRGQNHKILANTFEAGAADSPAVVVGSDATDNRIAYNQFLGGGVGIRNDSDSEESIDATLNWWGAASGPGESPASYVIGGGVSFSPWISGLTWSPSRLSLTQGKSQRVTAAFDTLASDSTRGSEPVAFSLWPVSSTTAAASVSTDGTVRGVSTGPAKISTELQFDPGLTVTVTSTTSPGSGGDPTPNPNPTPAPVVPKEEPVVIAPDQPLHITRGSLTISIPAGAVTDRYRLTVIPPTDTTAVDQVAQVASVANATELDAVSETGNQPLHTFEEKLTLTFRYDPAQFPDPSRLAIYWYDPAMKVWVSIGGVVDPVAGTITVTVDHFTLFAVLAPHEQAPTMDAVPTTTDQQTLTVTGTAAAGSNVTLVLGGKAVATASTDDSGAYSMTATLAEGRNLLYVKDSGLIASNEAVVIYTPAQQPPTVDQPGETEPGDQSGGDSPVTRPQLTDIAGHWAETAITRLVAQGIVSGFEDQTYRPDQAITRADFTTLLARALELKGTADLSRFTDAGAIPDWARASVAAAVAAGIVNGHADGSFAPDANITRAEAVVMLANALKYKGITATGDPLTLSDGAAIPDWAKASVQVAVNHQLITGYQDGTFRPDASATRAEVAIMLTRLLDAR